jgi:hypothetical protein
VVLQAHDVSLFGALDVGGVSPANVYAFRLHVASLYSDGWHVCYSRFVLEELTHFLSDLVELLKPCLVKESLDSLFCLS